MNMIIDDDNEMDLVQEDSDVSNLKSVVKQGLLELKEIVDMLSKLSPLMEPFGDSDTIDELVILYSEIIPNILVGNYEEALEGLNEDEQAIARLALNQRRKHIISNLMDKYNN